jgi:hypothetical protein
MAWHAIHVVRSLSGISGSDVARLAAGSRGMRKDLFYFAAGVFMTALGIKYSDAARFWDVVLLVGVAVMVFSVVDASLGQISEAKTRRMIALVGMAIFGGGFVGCAIWYFYQPAPLAKPASSGATAIRTAFDETQSIKVLPSSLGGNEVLRLGNLATLRRSVPYSLGMVTLELDVAPMRLPGYRDSVGDVTIIKGSGSKYTFDTMKNKRHEIAVGGRTYIVTLLE